MTTLSADLLFGAAKIAEFVGVEVRKVYHWMDRRRAGKDAPPVFDVGGQVCARRSELSSWFSGLRNLSNPAVPMNGDVTAEVIGPDVILANSHRAADITRNTYSIQSEQIEQLRE